MNFKPIGTNFIFLKKNKIYCKSLFFFLFFLNLRGLDFKTCILKKISNTRSILRSPNRNKGAQIQICTENYYFFIKIQKIIFNFQFNVSLFALFSFFKNFNFIFFESTVVYLVKKKIIFYVNSSNFIY